MKILMSNDEYYFVMTNNFDIKYLMPIQEYVTSKMTENWDDYNEFFHATRFIEMLEKSKNATVDFHLLLEKKTKDVVGFALCTSKINDYALQYEESDLFEKDKTLVASLDYFHVTKRARGNGGYWLEKIIFPYYHSLGKTKMYVKTTHDRARSLYARYGKKIGTYEKMSDNEIFGRNGFIYEMNIEGE